MHAQASLFSSSGPQLQCGIFQRLFALTVLLLCCGATAAVAQRGNTPVQTYPEPTVAVNSKMQQLGNDLAAAFNTADPDQLEGVLLSLAEFQQITDQLGQNTAQMRTEFKGRRQVAKAQLEEFLGQSQGVAVVQVISRTGIAGLQAYVPTLEIQTADGPHRLEVVTLESNGEYKILMLEQ